MPRGDRESGWLSDVMGAKDQAGRSGLIGFRKKKRVPADLAADQRVKKTGRARFLLTTMRRLASELGDDGSLPKRDDVRKRSGSTPRTDRNAQNGSNRARGSDERTIRFPNRADSVESCGRAVGCRQESPRSWPQGTNLLELQSLTIRNQRLRVRILTQKAGERY
jgi:hypothetical protein